MLSASVSGYVFTCCSSLNIYQAIKYLNNNNCEYNIFKPLRLVFHIIKYNNQLGNGGILLIVANYTGDVFNFGLACEKAKKIDNINVSCEIVCQELIYL